MKKCPWCSRKIIGHKNKKFCGQKCKDTYHNTLNPRGYFEHLKSDYDSELQNLCHENGMICEEEGWGGHKVWNQ